MGIMVQEEDVVVVEAVISFLAGAHVQWANEMALNSFPFENNNAFSLELVLSDNHSKPLCLSL